MEERKICRICNKSFSNGKALGGHVRSHFTKHPLPRKNTPPRPQSQKRPVFSDSQSSEEYKTAMPTRRRSERRRKLAVPCSEEEAALFLIQLSRDSPSKKVFRCEACDRGFGSYQALGGHKANHRRILKKEARHDEDEEEGGDSNGFDLNLPPLCDHEHVQTFRVCPEGFSSVSD